MSQRTKKMQPVSDYCHSKLRNNPLAKHLLPILPKHLKTVVIKKTSKQFNTVKSQINRDDVGKIVIATDAGREGQQGAEGGREEQQSV